ncbi:dolichyl-diphosphooligosaccharide--protein glycosyltransferase subunit 1A-like [Dorcoceras hygrometricum]|uniref:Dolichyl-diphosphooligosaccharide--protein glycosyltransferase subunit 1 n=1 Tax=Dorcoceras hygrometricum TaxID=472368 RepID=A0A2Z7DHU5_9LAMI|nr:dolichyl-diphosphooligosaccharide--protein glycosyltransferase subunit 1A-like [Dorcoceras hygrometricum]
MKRFRFDLPLFLLLGFCMLFSQAVSSLVISHLDRKIDLSSQIVRSSVWLKIENKGDDSVSEILLPFTEKQTKSLAFLSASIGEGKGKAKGSFESVPLKTVNPEGMNPTLTWYAVSLPKKLQKGGSLTLEVKAVYTHILRPFPEKITQADVQLVSFEESAYYLSPYAVNVQLLTVKLPEPKVESYTKLDNSKFSGSEIKYGPYENTAPFSNIPITVHYVNNHPFSVARELVREIEISHWGNVQVTESYNLVHAGAEIIGEFSRLDYQARPHVRGASAFRNLVAKLPPRAHSIYYRDEIGNISTSNVWSDSAKTILEIEPRYPMFGGWRSSFTIGYGLPLQDFLSLSERKRVLDISFGCPMNEVVIENLTVKIVLPEGSNDISVSVPFPIKQFQETKFSHLDMVGRPVVVLEKKNAVPEHNQYFQVSYKFSNLSLLREPMMLIFGFFLFFVACIAYAHADLTISKSSASYLSKLQWDEVQTAIQQFQNVMNRCLIIHDKLEASLRDLSRTGDVQTCKAARKAADSTLKELSKELKPLLSFLQSSSQATQILPKVEELVSKEKELQEKLMLKHSTVTDSYEKKSGGREIENRVALIQQKISVLRQEVDDLLEVIDI